MKPLRSPMVAALATAMILMQACGGGSAPTAPAGPTITPANDPAATTTDAGGNPDGLVTMADLKLGDIDPKLVEKGKTTYDVKCQACHSTGDNRIVGPGWKGITTRRDPAWIMNMILNVDVMLDKDPEAQKLLEECLVRMPNQNLSHDEGREVLEFMRTL